MSIQHKDGMTEMNFGEGMMKDGISRILNGQVT